MRSIKYETKKLRNLFYKKKSLSLDVIKETLGTPIKMTVFRKLKSMSYRSSYSHKGSFYTLDEIAKYNEYGIWVYNRVYFSKQGSLMNTLYHLVELSDQGYFASELQKILMVRIQEPLFKLFSLNKISRCQVGGSYLYLSQSQGSRQYEKRIELIKSSEEKELHLIPAYDSPEIRQCLSIFLATLNEKQRRLFVAFESMKLGRGGDTVMANISGLNSQTIAKGRQELLSHNITPDRIRGKGGGRPSIKKN